MPYVNAVIHHGRIGRLYSGTPQLIMPHLTDRLDNVDGFKKVCVAKVFLEINWKTDLIRKSLKKIIYDGALSLS